ncbi:hypothetical protein TNCV_4746591 [Trichonephila clavipes]|nr:hypothetical protein TNCV_4746591 [Trichonephila clavipes]
MPYLGRDGLCVVNQALGRPDLSSLDCFLLLRLKKLVDVTAFDSDKDHFAGISEAGTRVREILDILKRVRQSLHRHFKHVSLLVDTILNSYCKHYTCQRRFQ